MRPEPTANTPLNQPPRRPGRASAWAMFGLFLLLLASLLLMSNATENSQRFGNLYSLLLLVNVVGLVTLVALIAANLARMLRQYRRREAGSQLTARLVLIFILLSVVPVTLVYAFSLQFLLRGIDSWFDVRVEQALDDALELSRSSFETRMREVLRQTTSLTDELESGIMMGGSLRTLALDDMRTRAGATELTLMARNGTIIATSSVETTQLVPNTPGDAVLLQVHQGHTYVGLDPIEGAGLHVRVVVGTDPVSPGGETYVLQALYPVAGRMSNLADSVQTAFAQYRELAFMRTPLKYSFTLTLSLVLLLTLLMAVWVAFYSARRLVAPVTDLAEGTRAVAAGDYDKQLPAAGYDELGFLVSSFNEMTRRISRAQEEVRHSQRQAESQRAYLEAVLGSLSSGVLTLDRRHVLRTSNKAADQILGAEVRACMKQPFTELGVRHPHLQQFVEVLEPRLLRGNREWREEVTLFGGGGRQVLMCQGSALPGSGFVVVFDDITTLIQAQRNAAWGEVARRLAHEIKNPLTPIQLSAERLRHKYLRSMEGNDAEVLDRLTHTIVQQVEAMKEMVNAFSNYARSPALQLEQLQLNDLVREILELYRGPGRPLEIETGLDPTLPAIEADAGRLRQVLHNLLRNAEEAAGAATVKVEIATRCSEETGCRHVELRVVDHGPGIPEEILGQLFEPYVTTKPKGTGLGLAIVKKIVEEHGGVIWAENLTTGGVCFGLRLPVQAENRDALLNHGARAAPES